jgi:hypothetical protein
LEVRKKMAKFKSGDMVMARNGKGDVYMVNRVFMHQIGGTPTEYYEFDNGSVDVRKRARSGWHPVFKADRGYKKVD